VSGGCLSAIVNTEIFYNSGGWSDAGGAMWYNVVALEAATAILQPLVLCMPGTVALSGHSLLAYLSPTEIKIQSYKNTSLDYWGRW
jgi:hypothetical protein